MEQFLGTVFIVIIVLYLLKWLFVLLSPLLLKLFVKKMTQTYGGAQGNQADEPRAQRAYADDDGPMSARTKEGIVLRVRRKQGQSISDVLGGEYVSFEEVSNAD